MSDAAGLNGMGGVVTISEVKPGEDVLTYVRRVKGTFDLTLYRQIIGAANPYKEGDDAIGVAAADDRSREHARTLLARTTIQALHTHPLFVDRLQELIWNSTDANAYAKVKDWTLGEVKSFLLNQSEVEMKPILPGLNSDVIAAVTKIMSNDDLAAIGRKVFHPLPGSQLGAKGYMGARIQPNSPTDHPDDIVWQVFNGFSFATGDVLLGTNPVDSSEDNIFAIEQVLQDVVVTFGLADIMPWSVLAHIDVQAAVEVKHPGSVALMFQSLAGTDDANKTFNLSLDKMLTYAKARTGPYSLYFETGQGADFTNGAAHGFDMVTHESRKYGFARALKQEVEKVRPAGVWLHLNDVAGFIGPEVFKTREQLVRTALEDIVMGKLHGLCIGLDICSTLHMPVSLEDLDWAVEQIMPANPGYLMALPTKNDPMLSYLTTAFQDHVRLRERFGYKVNDAMWAFYQRIGILDEQGKFTEHAGDPIWVYYQYRLAKGDTRSKEAIYAEGRQKVDEVQARGVPLAIGHGRQVWEMQPDLKAQNESLYRNAKASLWVAFTPSFVGTIPNAVPIATQAKDREAYIAHPASGEQLSEEAIAALHTLKTSWGHDIPDVQIVISDGLNAHAIMDDGHLAPYLETLREELHASGFDVGQTHLVVRGGRVRAGYAIGEVLFAAADAASPKAIVHVIGERPGTGHHNYSVYLAAPKAGVWQAQNVDHDIGRVISGISDTSMPPAEAAAMTVRILKEMIRERR
ncbi:MAG: ethanolamine ammonia-lyase [Candidatus Tectomicrobia bacterium]|nr:ethanolamine ammonia-lyase [Candidatus Tectomicrobia bacterium]